MHAISLFSRSQNAQITQCKSVHRKKLYNLVYFDRDKESNDPDQVIKKFSSYNLSNDEKSLLAKELNFSIPPRKLNRVDYLKPFEVLFKDVKSCELSQYNMDILLT